MTPKKQLQHFDQIVQKMRSIMISKGNDYSGVEDRLINFKSVGLITHTPAAKVALIMVAMKVSRMCQLIDSGKQPENESMIDSSLDLCVYSILTNAIQSEEIEEGKKPTMIKLFEERFKVELVKVDDHVYRIGYYEMPTHDMRQFLLSHYRKIELEEVTEGKIVIECKN